MPLYEYECEACGKRFEKIVKFSDPPLDVCPNCGKGPVTKLLSSPAFQFKGSGWYVTDYGKGGAKDTRETKDTKEAKDTKDTKDTKEAKDTKDPAAKTDTKTETKTESKKESTTKSE
jgi:putative FmdB family regulatory protein